MRFPLHSVVHKISHVSFGDRLAALQNCLSTHWIYPLCAIVPISRNGNSIAKSRQLWAAEVKKYKKHEPEPVNALLLRRQCLFRSLQMPFATPPYRGRECRLWFTENPQILWQTSADTFRNIRGYFQKHPRILSETSADTFTNLLGCF